jgi:hypothetical protein
MDCFSLYKSAKSTGNYWANAVQYTICNAMLGVKVLKSLEAQLKKNHQKLEHESVYICNVLKNTYFKVVN